MNIMMALQGLLPLLVFAVVDMFASLRTALVAALVMAIGEVVWSYWTFGEIDQLTWISLGLVVVMGGTSIYMQSDRMFKFQPVLLAAIIAGTLAYFHGVGEPLLIQMIPKVAQLLPEDRQEQMRSPIMLAKLTQLDLLLIFMFIIHGVLVAWAAIRCSTLVWLLARGVGLYVLMAVTVILNAVI